jgi:hypothetical protein
MPLNPQTSPFPPISQPEQGWEHSLRKSLEYLQPGEGIRAGLELGLPLTSGGAVTTGLTPTLTSGVIVEGDKVIGPYGPKVTAAAAKNLSNKNIYFGLQGLTYGDTNNAAPLVSDVLIGSLSTDNEATASILHIGQQYNYGACRFGVRGVVNLAKCTKGSDVTFFTWSVPAIGLKNVRLTYAHARVAIAATAGNTAGDDFVLKVKQGTASAVSLVTIDDADLVTAGTIVRDVPASADALSWYDVLSLTFQYNQTDTSTAIAGGAIEVMAILEMF